MYGRSKTHCDVLGAVVCAPYITADGRGFSISLRSRWEHETRPPVLLRLVVNTSTHLVTRRCMSCALASWSIISCMSHEGVAHFSPWLCAPFSLSLCVSNLQPEAFQQSVCEKWVRGKLIGRWKVRAQNSRNFEILLKPEISRASINCVVSNHNSLM